MPFTSLIDEIAPSIHYQNTIVKGPKGKRSSLCLVYFEVAIPTETVRITLISDLIPTVVFAGTHDEVALDRCPYSKHDKYMSMISTFDYIIKKTKNI